MAEFLMAVGALIFFLGFLCGRGMPGRRPKAPELPKPICGCSHHYSFHDPKKGMRCSVEPTPGKTRCACMRYSGPEPLPEYFAPEIGGAGG